MHGVFLARPLPSTSKLLTYRAMSAHTFAVLDPSLLAPIVGRSVHRHDFLLLLKLELGLRAAWHFFLRKRSAGADAWQSGWA